jgi:hypothetical protein
MNNEKMNQIISDAWANYQRKVLDKFMNDTTISNYAITNKEEFINKCKTNPEFSKTWGLKIEERELSLLERYELMKKLDNWVSVHYKEPKTMEYMDSQNIPAKLITITYNNEIIESYE